MEWKSWNYSENGRGSEVDLSSLCFTEKWNMLLNISQMLELEHTSVQRVFSTIFPLFLVHEVRDSLEAKL